MRTVLVTGNFNVLHPGHIRLFKFAKSVGDRLVVGVFNNQLASTTTSIDENYRLEAVRALSFVDRASLIEGSLQDFIQLVRPDFIVKGKEYENQRNDEESIIERIGGQLIFSSGESGISADFDRPKITRAPDSTIEIIESFMLRHRISSTRLRQIVDDFQSKRVCVIGDTIVDEYIDCIALGMSREDPTIVVSPQVTRRFIGGASIVAAHASQLSRHVDYISTVGSDSQSEYVKSKLDDYNVRHHLFEDSTRPTTLKQRFRSDGRSLLKVSTLSQQAISKKNQHATYSIFSDLIRDMDVVLFSDFNYGCLPDTLLKNLMKISKNNKTFIAADSQSSSQTGDISRFRGADLITPTEREARMALKNSDDGLVTIANQLLSETDSKYILLTLGSDGLIAQYSRLDECFSGQTERISALNPFPVNLSGAGDSILTVASLALSTGADLWESSLLGSIAACIQVSRDGNIPISKSDIIEFLP